MDKWDAVRQASVRGDIADESELYWYINMSRVEGMVELTLKIWFNGEQNIFGGSTIVMDAPPEDVHAWLEANGIEHVTIAPILLS